MVLVPPAFILGTVVLIAAAGGIPTIDVTPGCRASATALGVTQDVQVCVRSEQTARDQLVKQWNTFAAGDRSSCVSLIRAGGSSGTYTDLLTCLEIRRDARRLPKEPGLPKLGLGGTGL